MSWPTESDQNEGRLWREDHLQTTYQWRDIPQPQERKVRYSTSEYDSEEVQMSYKNIYKTIQKVLMHVSFICGLS